MSDIVIKAENISKQYRLGKVGRKSLHDDIHRWWYYLLGKEDPYRIAGDANDRAKKGVSDYVWALRDINFEVHKGDVLGIIGRNGAGKSTLLKILSKVTAPTTGIVKLNGRLASLLEVGTGFHPELTARDNIFLNGAILGMTRKEIAKKFDAIVDFSGVERYIDTPVKRFSSGMYVRLAFAVAAHLEPDILIVDEVLAVGDAEFQKKCLGKIKEVSEGEGRTVLFVSHNIPSILKLCNAAIVLDMGKTVFSGSGEDAVDYYLDQRLNNISLHLAEREDRKGNGWARCTSIEICNEENKIVQSVKSGDSMRIKVGYDIKNEVIKKLIFRLQIVNAEEEIIFICNNEHAANEFPEMRSNGFVTCTIPAIPLFGGNYFINVQLASKELGMHDEVELAKEFTVADGDFFGTGKIPGIRKGVLVQHNWNVSNGQ